MTFPLGRLPLDPDDTKHLEKYPLREALPTTVDTVERLIRLPYAYRPRYNQGSEGACVGFAWSWAMSILNRRYYDAFWLYREAQKVDEWPGENYSGTSVRAGGDILRSHGHRILHRHRHEHHPELQHGIHAFRWGNSVDEVRTAIAANIPVVLGVEWYSNFDRPEKVGNEHWIGRRFLDLGTIRGGHAICCYGASDKRQAVKLVNSWGKRYELVWLPYATLERLLNGSRWRGEAAVLTDR